MSLTIDIQHIVNLLQIRKIKDIYCKEYAQTLVDILETEYDIHKAIEKELSK